MPMDYLCLDSGHNDLSKTLADYLLLKFKFLNTHMRNKCFDIHA